ncbi:MAG TPA: hypothetical protein VH092_18215 [Urbifossiella sp.]|jgi:hypothetical protein|nr:hypothetical protein [Urbifossiella sp.]
MTDDKYRRPGDAASRLAELREGRRFAEPPLAEAEEIEEEAGESFSMRSADRSQKVMLELRFKTDDATALAYSYLVRADLDPSLGILLDFSAYEVRIDGRNLRPLFSGLVAQRVAVVTETDELQAEAAIPKDPTVVTKIDVREKN